MPPAHEFESRSGVVHLTQHYVIKFVSDLRQVSGFLRVLPPPKKTKQKRSINVSELMVHLVYSIFIHICITYASYNINLFYFHSQTIFYVLLIIINLIVLIGGCPSKPVFGCPSKPMFLLHL
jgi:hypothetical protein